MVWWWRGGVVGWWRGGVASCFPSERLFTSVLFTSVLFTSVLFTSEGTCYKLAPMCTYIARYNT